MTDEKFKKVVVSSTVGAVLLVVFLLVIMVYQLAIIGSERRREAELNAAIEEYRILKEDSSKELDACSKRWWIEERARELGYRFIDDKLYK